ncbi:MAG: hypothetical protein KGI14_01945 [Acidobacteriota bacterium]|nr:hypothetical protein [Acidobacteriota bacterium]
MSDNPLFHENEYNPATMPTSTLSSMKAVWYKRPWFLITAVIVVVIVASIISDLPHPLTNAQDFQSQRDSIKSINVELRACEYALGESENFYREANKGPVPPDHAAVIKNYLIQDLNTCSGASGQSDQLVSNIQIVATTAGKHVAQMQYYAATWVTVDAYHAVLDIQTFMKSPHDKKNLANLAYYEAQLNKNRGLARAQIDDASRILGATLPYPNLPVVQPLPGT